jgi:N-acetylglucosamine kinase-like BadF-type ATPase
MKLFAGIDGGGTRTRLALVCEDGALAGYAEGGSRLQKQPQMT